MRLSRMSDLNLLEYMTLITMFLVFGGDWTQIFVLLEKSLKPLEVDWWKSTRKINGWWISCLIKLELFDWLIFFCFCYYYNFFQGSPSNFLCVRTSLEFSKFAFWNCYLWLHILMTCIWNIKLSVPKRHNQFIVGFDALEHELLLQFFSNL